MEALGDGGGTVVEIVTDRTREACLHVLPLRLQNSHLLLHYHMNLGYKRFSFLFFMGSRKAAWCMYYDEETKRPDDKV